VYLVHISRLIAPSGTFKPFRMEIDHFSKELDDAPMPYSIFFTQIGHAIHGTYQQRSLGRAVSHGCVRLSVKNAATLWKLVNQEKMANTKVVLSGSGCRKRCPTPPSRSCPRSATWCIIL
jgi:lipoprotein-anchoring transpeptidase ErfK/SrfK